MGIAKNSFYSIFSQILTILSSFGALIIISRTLGPAGQGYYSLVIMLPKLAAQLMTWGVPIAFIYYWNQKPRLQKFLLKRFRKVYLLLSVSSFIIASTFVYFTKGIFYNEVSFENLLKVLLCVFLMFYNSYEGTKVQLKQKFRKLGVIQLIQPTSLILSIVLLLALESLTLDNLITAFLVSHLFNFTLLVLSRKKNRLEISESQTKERKKGHLRSFFKYSFFFHLNSVSTLLTYRMDVFFISKHLSLSDIGIYMISVNIAERVWVISESVSKVLFSRLVTLDDQQKTSLSLKMTRVNIVLNIIIILSIALLGKFFIQIFFGDEYSDSFLVLILLLPGVFLSAIGKLLGNSIDAKGYPKINSYIAISALTFNFVANLALIPRFGLEGAALATTLTYSLQGILSYLAFIKVNKIGPFDLFRFDKDDFGFLKGFAKKIFW